MSSANREKENVRDLLDRTIGKEKQARLKEFLVPYTERSKTAVVKMLGANYRFRIIGFRGSGFGIFKPIDPTCAKFSRDAEIDQVHDYLQLLPQVYLILVCETDLGWCAYPFNLESAKHKGVDCEVIVRNISDVERFDVISARCDGDNFWYEEPFAGADPVKSEQLRECFAMRTDPLKMEVARKKLSGVTPEENRSFELAMTSWRQFQKQTTEGQIKEFLARGGAELDSYVIRGSQIELTWQAKSGRYYKSRVDKNSLDVVSAGICLDGADRKFHVKDLPGIIREGEDGGVIYVTDHVVDNPRHLDINE